MIENIHWLGHASFKITNGSVIYIDPYKLKKNSEKADIIFITHDHFDHLSAEDINVVVRPDTKFVAPPSCAKALPGNVTVVNRGDSIDINGINVQVVAAYNIGKDFHPRQSDNVAYILSLEGARIYHAGDTDVIPEMNDIQADIALLPCGGTYTMTAPEAAEAAKIINPKIAVPMHWGSIVGSEADARKFAELCTGCEVKILKQE